MLKKIKNFWDNKINRLILSLGLIFLTFVGTLYVVMGKGAKNSLIEQMLDREEIITRASVGSMENFLSLLGNSLSLLAGDNRIVSLNGQTQSVMEEFFDKWTDSPVGGIVVIDSSGFVKFNVNRDHRPDIGESLSDRDYFLWAKEAKPGDVYLSEVIMSRVGASKGQYITLLATPIYKNGKFQGVLGAAVILSELADTFFKPLKISSETQIYLLQKDGTFLYAPYPELVGINLFNYLKENPFLGSDVIVNLVSKKIQEGRGDGFNIAIPNFYTKKLLSVLFTYYPFSFKGRHWFLAISTPEKDALTFIAPFYNRQILIMIVTFSVLSAVLIMCVKSNK